MRVLVLATSTENRPLAVCYSAFRPIFYLFNSLHATSYADSSARVYLVSRDVDDDVLSQWSDKFSLFTFVDKYDRSVISIDSSLFEYIDVSLFNLKKK